MEAKTKESNELKNKKPKKWPKVAIIILNWNGWKDTIECLESVFRNNYSNYQVIVIDNGSTNGSTDGSIEKMKAWADGKQEVLTPEPSHPLYHLSHPPTEKPIPYICYTREEAEKGGNFKLEEKIIKEWQEQRKSNIKELNLTSVHPLILIQTGENLGFAGGNNVGLRYGLKNNKHDYFLLLNNDTVVEPNFLNKLVKTANTNRNIGVVGGKIIYYNEPNKIWYAGGKLDLIRGSGYHSNYNRIIDKDSSGGIKINFVTGCLMLINSKALSIDELLLEKYFLYVEDVDFCYSTFKKGLEIFVNLDSVIYHKISSTINHNESGSPDAVYYLTRNRLYFMLRRQRNKTKKIEFLLFFGVTRLFRVLQWLLEMKKGYIIATFKGIKDGYGGKLGRRR